MKRSRKIKVIHTSPDKKGKQEYRFFRSQEDALDYIARNLKDGRQPGRLKRGKVTNCKFD